MGRSKVIYGGETLIDLTNDTVAPSVLLQGYTAHDKAGELITGIMSGGSGEGLEYESGIWTPTSNVARGEIAFSKTHSKAPAFFVVSDPGESLQNANSNLYCEFFDLSQLVGNGVRISSSIRYGGVLYMYKTSSSGSSANVTLNYPYTNTGDSNINYPRYWATETRIMPYSNGTSRYWRAGVGYKWLAIWI